MVGSQTNPVSKLTERVGDTPNLFTWNEAYGYEFIPFTGLYHVGAREYDPRTARWLQRDPIDVAGGHPNVYAYCANDPLNHADPSGLGPDAGTLFDIGIGFIPVVGALWDIGKGIAEGDWVRVGVGAVSLVVDVVTLGSSRTVVGAARAGMVGARLVRGAVDCRVLITLSKGTVRQAVIHLQDLRFASKEKLVGHFKKHGHEVGAKDPSDYFAKASAFVSRADQPGVLKHIGQEGQNKGKIYLYDPCTNEFAVIAPDGKTLLSYYKPDKGKKYWNNILKR